MKHITGFHIKLFFSTVYVKICFFFLGVGLREVLSSNFLAICWCGIWYNLRAQIRMNLALWTSWLFFD